MYVKGMAFAARRDLLIRELGEEKWNAFFEAYTKENPAFSRLILTPNRLLREARSAGKEEYPAPDGSC